MDTQTTRRTIVKSGAKLAYAAPLVAASFKLRTSGAFAISGNPNPECVGATCSTFIDCGPGGGCVCFSTSSGGGYCATGSNPCSELTKCPNGQGDCSSDSICIVNSCCGENVCQPLIYACSTTTQGAVDIRTSSSGPTPAHP